MFTVSPPEMKASWGDLGVGESKLCEYKEL